MTYKCITRNSQLFIKEDVQRAYHVGKGKRKREGRKNEWMDKLNNQWENKGLYFAVRKEKGILCIYSLKSDKFPAWYGVFLAAFHERIHILHDDKGSLLQGDNAQVVVVGVAVCKGAVPRPHWVLEAQGVVLPLPHLKGQDPQTAQSCLMVLDKGEPILNGLGHRHRELHGQDSWFGVLLLKLL